MGDPGTKSYQKGVCGLICVSIGVLEVKKFENHWQSLLSVFKFVRIAPQHSFRLKIHMNLAGLSHEIRLLHVIT